MGKEAMSKKLTAQTMLEVVECRREIRGKAIIINTVYHGKDDDDDDHDDEDDDDDGDGEGSDGGYS